MPTNSSKDLIIYGPPRIARGRVREASKGGCVHISGLSLRARRPLALMEIRALPALSIPRPLLASDCVRFSGMQLTALYAIALLNPRNPLKLVRSVCYQAVAIVLYSSPLVSNTQAVRTVLLANATAATFRPRRSATSTAQRLRLSSFLSATRRADRAP